VAADAKRPQRWHGELTGEAGGDWWRGDVDRGFEVAASDRPGQNGRAFKGAWCPQVGRHVVSMWPVSSDRRARVEVIVVLDLPLRELQMLANHD
jgi:hypothetical protein